VTTGEGKAFWPQFLGDSQHFIYADSVARSIHVASLDNDRPRTLMTFPVRMSSLAYVPGYILFVQDASLFARPFDETRLEFAGEAIRLLDGIPVTGPGQTGVNVGSPHALFPIPNVAESDWLLYPTANAFVAASNDQRFLVAVRGPDPNAPPINIVVNWRALLNR
jgi:hypothetical protein